MVRSALLVRQTPDGVVLNVGCGLRTYLETKRYARTAPISKMTPRGIDTTPPYKMATIVRLTSFAPQRLRAWEQRYDLLRPSRGDGGHRLYSDEDLRVLGAVRELLDSGRTIGEINRIGRAALLAKDVQSLDWLSPTSTRTGRPATQDTATGAHTLVCRIVQATLEMDESELNRVLDEAFVLMPAEAVIDQVIAASLGLIGTMWAEGSCTISSEHLATRIFTHRVRTLLETAASANHSGKPRLLCACFPQERHELGILTLSHSLTLRKARVTVLGSEVPMEDLDRACVATVADAVLLSVSDSALYLEHKAGLFDLRSRIDMRTKILLGGAGAPVEDEDLSAAGVTVVASSGSTDQTAESLLSCLEAGQLSHLA